MYVISHLDKLFSQNRVTKLCCYIEEGFNRQENEGLLEFWSSKRVLNFRDKILRGDYSSCPPHCGVLVQARSQKPNERVLADYSLLRPIKADEERELSQRTGPKSLVMALEDGCNLSCPSCRPDFRGNSLSQSSIDESWKEVLNNLDGVEEIVLGGSGEPLIQKNVKDFLFNFDMKNAQGLKRIYIQTNGLLLSKDYWNNIDPIKKEMIHLLISIDGVSNETYEVNRRGGDFHTLQKNLNYLSKQGLKYFEIGMVVQKNNFHEMRDFIDWSKRLGAKASFQKLEDWSCMDEDLFKESDVSNPSNEKHEEFLNYLKTLPRDDNTLYTNLIDFLN